MKGRLMRKSPKLVCGIGVNDADYVVRPSVDGKTVRCPVYQTWTNMLDRCNSARYKDKNPTYISCTVCDEWKSFTSFKAWMQSQDWQGKHLDKDIIDHGNKEYSPEKCVFVSRTVNLLLTDNAARRGKYPIGVYFNKRDNKFMAYCGDGDGNQKHLGCFETPEEAHNVWTAFKSKLIRKIASEQTDDRIKYGLMRHADIVENKH